MNWQGAIFAIALTTMPFAAAGSAERPFRAEVVELVPAACIGPCLRWLSLSGKIVPGANAIVRRALARNPDIKLVSLDSPGGHVEAAMDLGRLLRARGVNVVVAGFQPESCYDRPENCRTGAVLTGWLKRGVCASACVHVMAGGVRRSVLAGSPVGVHRYQVIRTRTAPAAAAGGRARTVEIGRHEQTDPKTYALSERYFASMGVDPRIVDRIRDTPHATIHLLPQGVMTDLRLTTDADPVTLVTDPLKPRENAVILNRVLPARRELYEIALTIDPNPGAEGHVVRGILFGPAWALARTGSPTLVLREQKGLRTALPVAGVNVAISTTTLCRLIGMPDRMIVELRLDEGGTWAQPTAAGPLRPHHLTGGDGVAGACASQ